MRYFLDTEYNGIGGELLSLALVPDYGDELYLTLRNSDPPLDWVERHVVPFVFPVQLKERERHACTIRTHRDVL